MPAGQRTYKVTHRYERAETNAANGRVASVTLSPVDDPNDPAAIRGSGIELPVTPEEYNAAVLGATVLVTFVVVSP